MNIRTALLGLGALVMPAASQASIHLLLESNGDRTAGTEIYTVDYDSRAQLLGNNYSALNPTQIDLDAAYSSADFAFGDGAIQLLLESNSDRTAGTEIYVVTYDSYADFLANSYSALNATQIDLDAGYSVHGFTFGDGAYQLLLESETDRTAGTELYMLTYDSLADLIANNYSALSPTQIDLDAAYSATGMMFDSSGYTISLESNADRTAGTEIYLVSYATHADVIANTYSALEPTQIDLDASYSSHGLEVDPATSVPGTAPEPASWAMLIGGLGVVGATMRRRKVCASFA